MILVDSPIWIDHLNAGDTQLTELLANEKVLTHPFVIGEIMLGSLRNRKTVREVFEALKQTATADDHEVLRLIEAHGLGGTGIGYVDAHLIAAVLLTPETRLWTRDRRLSALASRLSISHEALH